MVFGHPLHELFQRAGKHVMVIRISRITGDHTGGGMRRGFRRSGAGGLERGMMITGGEGENAPGFREDLLGIDPFMGVALEVGHLAVLTRFEPVRK